MSDTVLFSTADDDGNVVADDDDVGLVLLSTDGILTERCTADPAAGLFGVMGQSSPYDTGVSAGWVNNFFGPIMLLSVELSSTDSTSTFGEFSRKCKSTS